jgi:hypothetical protein
MTQPLLSYISSLPNFNVEIIVFWWHDAVGRFGGTCCLYLLPFLRSVDTVAVTAISQLKG